MTMPETPAYLLAHVEPRIAPPRVTRPQLLPLSDLSWPEFEQLCYRMVAMRADVEYCQIYGVPGQEQAGIDIYARLRDDSRYLTVQSRRIRRVTPAGLKSAVDDFLAGPWAARTGVFAYATTASLKPTKVADEVERQATRLRSIGVQFLPWDALTISTDLKGLPRLVEDFFDRPWTEAFCGREAAQQLDLRLSPERASSYRRSLGRLLTAIFDQHDAATLLRSGEDVAPLISRFVTPDVIELRETSKEEASTDIPPTEDGMRVTPSGRSRLNSQEASARIPVDVWLARNTNSLLIGAAGAGKSTILRYLALDLLAREPTWPAFRVRFGDALPIWLPFAYWVQQTAADPTASVSLFEAIRSWLHVWGASDLWPLVESALGDDRAVLLVDGLDEWTDPSAAGLAFDRLAVYAAESRTPVVATARPAGIEALGRVPPDWTRGSVADLTRSQQQNLATRAMAPTVPGVDRAQRVELFFREIDETAGVRDLARAPLLLVLLLWLFARDAHLPANRFAAYERVVDYLLRDQPAHRQRAAAIGRATAGVAEQQVRQALAALAFNMHGSGRTASPVPEAMAQISSHLADDSIGAGLPLRQAQEASAAVIDTARRVHGLLVDAGPEAIGFMHRSLQDHLAAFHLARMPLAVQLDTLAREGRNPAWREIFLTLAYLTTRAEDVDSIVRALLVVADSSALDRWRLAETMAELAAGPFGVSPALATVLLDRALRDVEMNAPPQTKRAVLGQLLASAQAGSSKDRLFERLRTWIPNHRNRFNSLLAVMSDWPADTQTDEALARALFDESSEYARAAGRALVARKAPLLDGGGWLLDLLGEPLESVTRAAVLETMALGWPSDDRLRVHAAAAVESADPDVRLVGHAIRTAGGNHLDSEIGDLLAMSSEDSGVDYYRRSDLVDVILSRWSGDKDVKDAALGSVRTKGQRRIDPSLAVSLLMRGFSDDPDVITYCVTEIQNERFPFLSLHLEAWRLLSRNFRDSPSIVAAIDAWLPGQMHNDPEISMASQVGRTDVARDKLLDVLGSGSTPHWAVDALLEGWGLGDASVGAALRGFAFSERASLAAYRLPDILTDATECIARLLEVLNNPSCRRPDFVLAGLSNLTLSSAQAEMAVQLARSYLGPETSMWSRSGVKDELFGRFSRVRGVRDLALEDMESREPNLAAIGFGFKDDPEIRRRLERFAAPLPAELRRIAAQHLGNPSIPPEDALPVLRYFDRERDALVAASLGSSLVRRELERGAALAATVGAASDLLDAVGPDFEVRRQAGLSVVLEAGALEVLALRQATKSSSRSIFPLGFVTDPNPEIGRLLVKNWVDLSSRLGDGWMSTLASEDYAPALWDLVAMFAEGSDVVSARVLDYVRGGGEPGPHVLALLSRRRPGTKELFDACVRAFRSSGRRGAWAIALDLLASQFSGDDRVVDEFGREHLEIGDALVLAETHPMSDAAEEAMRQVRGRYGPREVINRLQLCSQPADEAAQRLTEILHWLSEGSEYWDRPVGTLLRRVERDSAFRAILESKVEGGDLSGSEWTTVPRILARASGLTGDVRRACERMAERALRGDRISEIGLDLVAGRRRPLGHALLDALDAGPVGSFI